MEFNDLISQSLDFVFFVLPFFIVAFLGWFLFKVYVEYAREKFNSSQTYTLLRIYPPQEVNRSPAAMELFMNALFQTGGEGNNVDIFWHGKSRAVFSLEMCSHGGEVAFYIRTRDSLRKDIETQIYAQYPGAEIEISEDYTEKIDWDSGEYSMFGIEWKFTEPDPVPIKTYVDYGADKTGAEEDEKIDPITPTLEFLGSLGSGENAWIQMIVKAHKKEDHKAGTWFGKTDFWKDEAKELIEKIREESVYGKSDNGPGMPLPTKGQLDQIAAIERSVNKQPFDVGIRGIYIAEKEAFVGTNIPALIGSFKQYGSGIFNGFKPQFVSKLDFWWQDPFGTKVPKMQQQMFEDYQNRTYFNSDYGVGMRRKARQKLVMNSEELATIFHFPGTVSQTPSLNRVKSKKGEAPANLPI